MQSENIKNAELSIKSLANYFIQLNKGNMSFMLNNHFIDIINNGISKGIDKKVLESGQFIPILDAVNDII